MKHSNIEISVLLTFPEIRLTFLETSLRNEKEPTDTRRISAP